MNKLLKMLAMFATYTCCFASEDVGIMRFLDAVSSDDVVDDESEQWRPTSILLDYPGLRELTGTTNDTCVLGRFRDVATNLAFSTSIATNELNQARLSTAMMILGDYSLTNSLPLFSLIVTNSACDSLVQEISFYIGAGYGPSTMLVDFLDNRFFRGMSSQRVSQSCRGIFRGLNSIRGDVVTTNRIIWIALRESEQPSAWSESDVELCYIWPAYATSSNRYVSAISARNAVPPPASANYINRVIAELEALPPGTMQMLSTNHLGAAWNEN